MRLFWMAWSLAVLLVLVAIGGTAWVFAASEHWPGFARVASRAGCLLGSLAAFVGAFRLALLATASLRFVLARNLATLIVMELNDLHQAAQERAASFAEGGEAHTSPEASEALQIPRFFGDRTEIRKLLGPATEHTLEQLLISLQSYNQAVIDVTLETGSGSPAHRLWQEIRVVQERLKLAVQELAPFCLAS
jgi:hypothetical protein